MTTVTCDICKNKIGAEGPIRVEFLDGEHPHNGSTMYKTIDVCIKCLIYLPNLRCDCELSNVIK